MNSKRLLILAVSFVVVLGGCNRVARPIDVHTQYVAKDLVTPACLQKCDINGDGRIQYRLWPGTQTIDHREDADKPSEDDVLGRNPDAEFECWEQCRGGTGGHATKGGMVAPSAPAATGTDGAEAVKP